MSLSSESNMMPKEIQNSDMIYYNVNQMADVFKIIVKHRRKIIAKYHQMSPFIV